MIRILVFSLLIISSRFLIAQTPDPQKILEEMVKSSKNVTTIRYHAVMNERINNKMVEKDSYFKINTNPLKIYVRQSFIGIKLDALYNQGFNNNQLYIATVGFPWIKLNFDPKGKQVRDNHHHTIFEAGFSYFTGIVDDIIKLKNNKIKFQYAGIEQRDGKNCHKIVVLIDEFKFVPYTLKEGENISTVSERLNINDYMVLERNPEIDYYTDVKAGQVINIPNMYAKKMILYIEPELMLPTQIELFDDKGLYAVYSYNKLVINKPFQWDEFHTTFKDYHF